MPFRNGFFIKRQWTEQSVFPKKTDKNIIFTEKDAHFACQKILFIV